MCNHMLESILSLGSQGHARRSRWPPIYVSYEWRRELWHLCVWITDIKEYCSILYFYSPKWWLHSMCVTNHTDKMLARARQPWNADKCSVCMCVCRHLFSVLNEKTVWGKVITAAILIWNRCLDTYLVLLLIAEAYNNHLEICLKCVHPYVEIV